MTNPERIPNGVAMWSRTGSKKIKNKDMLHQGCSYVKPRT